MRLAVPAERQHLFEEREMRLNGKVCVITGAGSGMGRAMAELFASEGASVVVGEWNAQTMEEVVAAVSAKGGKITGVQGNVAVRAEAEAVVDAAVKAYGRIDVLVNNAGVMDYMQGVGAVSDDVWERVIGVNLTGPMYTSRRAVQLMLESGGGSIVNVASTASISGAASGAAYVASKHGVLGLTRSTAWTYAQKGIRCNAILPGGTKTNIMSSVDPSKLDVDGAQRVGLYHTLMPLVLEPIDIANVALFLSSDESRFINGAVIAADGGWSAA
jgi:NAD(P)-dependent dehydrogenase (short-subunit alcohol dehydrogenase family)